MISILKIPVKLNKKTGRLTKKGSRLLNKTRQVNVLSNSFHFLGALRSLTKGLVTVRQLTNYIIILRRSVGKGRISWPRIHVTFNLNFEKTKKSSGHRMGHGKGKGNIWSHVFLPGELVFKIITHSNKYIYFDSLTWSIFYAFFDYYLYSHFIFSLPELPKYKTRTKLYSVNTDSPGFDFGISFVKELSHLRFIIKGLHSAPRSFYKIFIKSLKFFKFLYKKQKRFKSFKFDHAHYSKMFVLLIISLSLFCFQFYGSAFRGRAQTNYTFYDRIKESLPIRQLLYKILIFNLIYNFFLMRRKQRKLNFLVVSKVPFLTKSLYKFWFKQTLYQNSKITDAQDRVAEFFYAVDDYYESDYEVERIVLYPFRRPTYIPLLYKGLRRIKFKTPFKSEILLPFSNHKLFFLHKKKSILKHTKQGCR